MFLFVLAIVVFYLICLYYQKKNIREVAEKSLTEKGLYQGWRYDRKHNLFIRDFVQRIPFTAGPKEGKGSKGIFGVHNVIQRTSAGYMFREVLTIRVIEEDFDKILKELNESSFAGDFKKSLLADLNFSSSKDGGEDVIWAKEDIINNMKHFTEYFTDQFAQSRIPDIDDFDYLSPTPIPVDWDEFESLPTFFIIENYWLNKR